MQNFSYHNPVRIEFGKGSISRLNELINKNKKILMTYGGGSIKKNGVYDQVMKSLSGYTLYEFGGIEVNPRYETLMKAVALAEDKKTDFLLSVGGGSVLDGTKFIAAAINYKNGSPWDIVQNRAPISSAVPIGSVITLPATGSEMNSGAVISRDETNEKSAFGSPLLFPVFSIIDPETTFTLPIKQSANGIIDTFVHVLEQYLTYDVNTPLQDRQAEAIMLTVIGEAPKVLDNPEDYDVRANLFWCATQALNGLIGLGHPSDWTSHMVGHELTAVYGIDHACSLAVVVPAVMEYKKDKKAGKLIQYAERVWGIKTCSDNRKIEIAIEKTKEFFRSLGIGTLLKDHGIGGDAAALIGGRIGAKGSMLGENQDIGGEEVKEILSLCV